MSTPVIQRDDQPSRLYIGSLVLYHGSITEAHGAACTLAPCWWEGPCKACDEEDEFADEPRFLLTAQDNPVDTLRHVRPESFTPEPHEWPEDAEPFCINRYWFMASHTTEGGGGFARTLHYYRSDGSTGRTWFRFRAESEETIRRLDAKALKW